MNVMGDNNDAAPPVSSGPVMDTGSGKTLVSILRIITELERCPTDKLVWFLAPTVALCLQQHDVIASQIPSVKTRVLTGRDNVDRWTEQAIWNNALKDVRVVCSTYAVLSDALNHGFVRMSQLALLIFDEAHHCMKGHPANKIMQSHYHPTRVKLGPHAVPRILGLTASPIVRSNPRGLQAIETNLDAVCKTPRIYRSELLKHVHRPHLECIPYPPCEMAQHGAGSRLLPSLVRCIESYDIRDDPYIELLRQRPGKALEAEDLVKSGGTYCNQQLAKFLERSNHMYEELGGWATDYFIEASIDQLRRSIEEDTAMTRLDRTERVYLLELLLGMSLPEGTMESTHISPKLEILLSSLVNMDHPEFSGMIFAQRRATVNVLTKVLSLHPATKGRFRCASYVGWSNSTVRREFLGDLLTQDMQRDTLSEFKAGRKNLIIGTDVLEEGLDVSACRLVICYDRPANLKSFVQRRGRARHPQSTYVIMLSADDESLVVSKWQELEVAMIEAYQDDERQRQDGWKSQATPENVDEWLFVASTRYAFITDSIHIDPDKYISARLSADEAMQHLHHFCSLLPTNQYVDSRPMFTFEEGLNGLIRGTVTLPNSVHPAVRQTQGKAWWRTENAARKEAAFQTYKALWEYGLVNDNLLPLTRKPELRFTEDMALPALLECSEQYDPYINLAHDWVMPEPHQTSITVLDNSTGAVSQDLLMSIVLPKWTPMPEPLTLFWENKTTLTVTFGSSLPVTPMPTPEIIQHMRNITAMYLQAPSTRVQVDDSGFVALFVPSIPCEQLESWLQQNEGTEKAVDLYASDPSCSPVGIIRDKGKYSEPRLFRMWHHSEALEIECHSLPKRRNLLQYRNPAQAGEDQEEATPKMHTIPAAGCVVDKLPWKKSMFGRFISAILDRFEATMVVHRLNDTILKGVGIQNISHVLTAITTPIAQASTNYQLYEFFGDSILKFTVSCQLFFSQPTWHEGYLSESRDTLIQNKRLARAALDTGLDQYILTNRFTPRKWDAPLISRKAAMAASEPKRKLSMKVLADVVEALIGAAYMDGGLRKAQACLHRFLPEIDIARLVPAVGTLAEERVASNLIDADRIGQLIGYTFKDASLLTEALTHPSCEHDTHTQSYQRIEYLGDAVLDMAVVSVLAERDLRFAEGKMTLIKHSVVNAGLLAFLCMEMGIDDIYLWKYLRFNGPVIQAARDASLGRHKELREEILHELKHGSKYPWELFSRLRPDKFLSDIVESTLGAIFIDSGCDFCLGYCTAFVERLGLLLYVRRIISDGVDLQHPRNRAQDLVAKTGAQLLFKTKRVEASVATYHCSATINKKEIASIQGCASADEAEVKTALLVIEKFAEQNADPIASTNQS
ncbi:Dicer-like protein 2 [Penicillium canariense]|uniref:Dicer-like protein 2 n=1 Tax=Penicillium canariense TaxID=189055 RepID=A0A9W9HQ17_9EURO|nr:Dicer-like protein 2 [Penicillium canariense]KAJ5152605.1 Dicer-like protein 2 [Penicillium canariense]